MVRFPKGPNHDWLKLYCDQARHGFIPPQLKETDVSLGIRGDGVLGRLIRTMAFGVKVYFGTPD